MSDPLTTAIITAGGAWISKEALNKLLGPSAEYFGEAARDLIKQALQNFGRVLSVSCDKLKGQLEHPGGTNLRVLKGVCDEAPFTNDVFSAEYFGGLLASARSKDGKDDSAMPFIAVVRSLSSFQLRLHFIVYSLLATRASRLTSLDSHRNWEDLELHIPADELIQVMQLLETEGQDIVILALTGLVDQRLLAEESRYNLRGLCSDREVPENTVIVAPSARGAQLFLRALGLRGLSPDIIFSIDVDNSISSSLKPELRLPQSVKCVHHRPVLAVDKFREILARQVETLESKCDDLDSRIDDHDDRLGDLERPPKLND